MNDYFGPIIFFSTLLAILVSGCAKNGKVEVENSPYLYCEESMRYASPRVIYECFKHFEKEETNESN